MPLTLKRTPAKAPTVTQDEANAAVEAYRRAKETNLRDSGTKRAEASRRAMVAAAEKADEALRGANLTWDLF